MLVYPRVNEINILAAPDLGGAWRAQLTEANYGSTSCQRVPLSVHDAILRCYGTVNMEQVRSGPMAGRAVLVTGGTGKAIAQAFGHAHR